MTESNSTVVAVMATVLVLGAAAAVLLLHNFTTAAFSATWPVLLIAIGGCLIIAGYLELGLVFVGSFVLVLLANLGVIPIIAKSWPCILIWLALVVVIGYLRSRARDDHQSSGSSLSL